MHIIATYVKGGVFICRVIDIFELKKARRLLPTHLKKLFLKDLSFFHFDIFFSFAHVFVARTDDFAV